MKTTKLDKEIQNQLYDPTNPEKVRGVLHYAIDKLFDPKTKGTLKITGDKPKLTRLKKHLEQEHPSTKGHMKVLDPPALYKSIVEYKGKKYHVVDRYGIDKLSPNRRYYEHIIRLDLVPVPHGRVPEDVITVDEDDVKVIEATSAYDPKKSKFMAPYHVDIWEERDRLIITVYDKSDKEVASWIDDDARQMFEDGFFDRRNLEDSVLKYLQSMGTIKSYDPKKPAEIYVVTDSKGNKHKASYSEWLKWMKEQTKRMYDPNYKKVYRIYYESKSGKRDVQGADEDDLDIVLRGLRIGGNMINKVIDVDTRKEIKWYDLPKSKTYLQRLAKGATRPPKRWFYAMVKGIKKRSDVMNPYAIVENIWARLKPSERAEIERREAKGEVFKYDLPLPKDVATKGIGTVRTVKPFKLAEVQANVSAKDYKALDKTGLFTKMKRQDGSIALVKRCKSSKSNANLFIDRA